MDCLVLLFHCSFLLFVVQRAKVSSLSILQRRDASGQPCSPDELSTFVERHVNDALSVMNKIHFSSATFKQQYLKNPNLKRTLLMWDFTKVDRDRNGILDSTEIALLSQSVTKACASKVFEYCDLDGTDGVSQSEWLICLGVKEPRQDSCTSKPNVNTVELPTGCVDIETDQTSVDLGICDDEACQSISESEECSSDGECCCGPVKTVQVAVRCNDDSNMTFDRVTNCGCGNCENMETLTKRRI